MCNWGALKDPALFQNLLRGEQLSPVIALILSIVRDQLLAVEIECTLYIFACSWYRVCLFSVEEEAGKISRLDLYFADYGNSDFFELGDPSRMQLLRRLPFEFLQLPFQAIRCTMDDILPIGVNCTTCYTVIQCTCKLQCNAESTHTVIE